MPKQPDPTKNVLALVKEANKRTDDLMLAHQRSMDRELYWMDKYSDMRFTYEEKLVQKQSARHDANEELIRIMINQVADTVKESTDRTVERVSALELSYSQNQGKSSLTDPMMTEMLGEMKSMRNDLSNKQGNSTGMHVIIAYIFAGVGILVAIAAIVYRTK